MTPERAKLARTVHSMATCAPPELRMVQSMYMAIPMTSQTTQSCVGGRRSA